MSTDNRIEFMKKMESVSNRGYKAARSGKTVTACPYSKEWNPCRRKAWLEGHRLFTREMSESQQQLNT